LRGAQPVCVACEDTGETKRRGEVMKRICLTLCRFSPSRCRAQSWPTTIRAIVPYTADSGTDVTARVILNHLSSKLGQSIVVENRFGAGETIGRGKQKALAEDVSAGAMQTDRHRLPRGDRRTGAVHKSALPNHFRRAHVGSRKIEARAASEAVHCCGRSPITAAVARRNSAAL
jgi:hypothetical protein